jgi:hypothetical protein
MSADPNKQWRIDNAHHLKGTRLRFLHYTRWSETWDHDHCSGCMVRFAEFEVEGEEVQHDGFATCEDYKHGARYAWVCRTCFEDLKEEMGWIEA